MYDESLRVWDEAIVFYFKIFTGIDESLLSEYLVSGPDSNCRYAKHEA
jgi:hypothetical protein